MCIFDNYSHDYKTRRNLDLDKILLNQYGQSTLVLDDSTPDFDETCFINVDWSEYFPYAAEWILLAKTSWKHCFNYCVLLMLIMPDAVLLDNDKLVF